MKVLARQDSYELSGCALIPGLDAMIEDLENLYRELGERKQAKPNCRPVTAAELQQLCAASNVVSFQPAA